MVEIGTQKGRVLSHDFGHVWWEYFGVDVWAGAIDVLLDGGGKSVWITLVSSRGRKSSLGQKLQKFLPIDTADY